VSKGSHRLKDVVYTLKSSADILQRKTKQSSKKK